MIIALLIIIVAVLLFGAKSVRAFISSAITVIIGLIMLSYGSVLINENSWGWGIAWIALGGLLVLVTLLGFIFNMIVKIMEAFNAKNEGCTITLTQKSLQNMSILFVI
ncbi:hypothetical protein [uncultured Brevibacillus sp.]|uniref:hypothetical protein n=1 Tax=uncultured Brevibacillus sp. TaxID=169970 RepID=UPI0025975298|nr:hypothetical protein [uncultured Brevibacillus sp.]